MSTALAALIAEHADDRAAQVEALVAFDYAEPESRAEPDGSAAWYWDCLTYDAGPNTLAELDTRVATGELDRSVYNEVVARLTAG